MITKRIENNWRLRRVGEQEWVDAVVPGSVYTDLYRNKKIEDPYFKDNEYEVKALMENDYEYETVIQVEDGEFSKCDEVFLKFEGLDTLADIYLNDTHLGNAYNMHRIWTYQITNALQIGENTLRVVFHSPLKFMAEAFEKYGNIGNDDTIEGFMHLRKAHYMSGWDWGACLPDAGILMASDKILKESSV